MSSKEELFKNALIELAKEGNEKAKFILTMAETGYSDENPRSMIVSNLKEANNDLSEALYQNGLKWSRQTDRDIQSAQRRINNVLGLLAR